MGLISYFDLLWLAGSKPSAISIVCANVSEFNHAEVQMACASVWPCGA
jgi:hypothetical protein